MNNNWKTNNFEDCLERVVYTNKIQRKDFLENGEYPIISQEQDFINGYWNNADDLFRVKKPVVIFGDHTQVLKYVDFDFVLGADGVKILQPIDELNPRYFFYFLNNVELKTLGYARHYRLLKELLVSFPPLAEQQRIVAILDEAFAAIAQAKENAEKNLQNARELFDSYLQSVFANPGDGWEERTLAEICRISHGYAFDGKDFKSDFNGNEPIVLTPGNFLENGGLYFNQKNTKRCIGKYPKEFLFNKGDLVVVMTDLSSQMKILGKPAIITDENILHNQRIGRFIFQTDSVSKEFLFYYLLTNSYLKNIKETATGTMVRHTAPSRILSNSISFPSLSEQKSIVTRIDSLLAETKKLENIYRQKINGLDELKKSILQKAFNGELSKYE